MKLRLLWFKLTADRNFRAHVFAQLCVQEESQIVDLSRLAAWGIVAVKQQGAFNSEVVLYKNAKCWMKGGLLYWQQ